MYYQARLYFSDTSEQTREAAISRTVSLLDEVGFTGATITRTIGVWERETEPGFVLEILHPTRAILAPKVEAIAARLALEYSQESVLVAVDTVETAVLVSPKGVESL